MVIQLARSVIDDDQGNSTGELEGPHADSLIFIGA